MRTPDFRLWLAIAAENAVVIVFGTAMAVSLLIPAALIWSIHQ